MSFFLCMQTKILHIHIMLPPPPCGWVGGVYDNYIFVWIYVCMALCQSVCLSVCMYVCTCARKVGMSFLLCLQTKILHIHIMLPPPPVGGLGGASYHLQPCLGITMRLYWFRYLWLYVCLSVCLYVCACPRKVGMSFFLCMQTKILHIHIMLPPPPPVGGLGGSYHLQPCIGITICLYWFMYDNYMFVLIYVW